MLYQHYKSRYPNWQSTKADADLAIERLKAAGYKSATKQGVLDVIKSQRLSEIQKRKEAERPPESIELFFTNHPQLLDLIHFFEIDTALCLPWREISKKIILWTKHIWTSGAVYPGGAVIPYNETFANLTRLMAKQQDEARREGESRDYTTDWFYKLLIKSARWDKNANAYFVEITTCNEDGERTFYGGEELGPELPTEPEERPAAPEKIPPEAIPEPGAKPPAVPGEITPEQRVEIEKEKARAEAQARKEYKIAQGRQYAELLKDKVITFEQFKELMGDLNKT
jgi:hypothetical protein